MAVDYDRLVADLESAQAQIEAQFTLEQLVLIAEREKILSLIAGWRQTQKIKRFAEVGLKVVEAAANAAERIAERHRRPRRRQSANSGNKTDKILTAARNALSSMPGKVASFRDIFEVLPSDIKTIWGDSSKEGIRSTLKRAGDRVDIEMLADKRFRLVR